MADTILPRSLSERVAWARGHAGLSKRGLSRLAGLDPSHVRQLEASGTRPAEATVRAIAGVLGVPASWLAFGEGDFPKPEDIAVAVVKAQAAPVPLRAHPVRHSSTGTEG